MCGVVTRNRDLGFQPVVQIHPAKAGRRTNMHRGHAKTEMGDSRPLHSEARTDAGRVMIKTIAVVEKMRAGKSH